MLKSRLFWFAFILMVIAMIGIVAWDFFAAKPEWATFRSDLPADDDLIQRSVP